ncbi:MAG: PhoH family protein [Bacteroidota bacterium]|nr:PhoH family protein [Bacteroidota bacterium]
MVRKKSTKKIFVLDTSVILHNHQAITSFEDNDVVIPITVLEELDNFKKGNETKNFETREFIRMFDKLSEKHSLQEWIPLGKNRGHIKVALDKDVEPDAKKMFGADKPDHRILNTAILMSQEYPDKQVTVVTKDINLRIKAKALKLNAEDYETGKIQNIDSLYAGINTLEGISPESIDKIYNEKRISPEELGINNPYPNHYYIIKDHTQSVLAFYNPLTQYIEPIEKRTIQKITPRNAEQTFALHAILNPNVQLVTLQGVAGTGKTLLALAGALEQRREFRQIYLARPIVPLSNKDLGFLPGDIKDKIGPYMEPLFDNLKLIKSKFDNEKGDYKELISSLEGDKLIITPLAYIRGRSLSNICFIVDEAQNLTPHEVKTIISRAGENTKIIFTGDIYQIDTPYLDSQSNGLSYLIDKIKHHKIYAHIRLEKGERSELANLANDLL